MQRFVSTILTVLFAFHSFAYLPGPFKVAAQDVQQSQNSGAPVTPPETLLPVSVPAQSPSTFQIPDGTPVDIEAPFRFNSMEFKPNDKISFRVVNPIKVNGITVIEKGATATGRIDKAKRGGHFGKAGLFVWTMETVTAIDGSQIPLRVAPVRLRGDSKGAKVATQMIITGALMPLIAPIALLHGFKRGKDAFIPEGKRYSVYVEGNVPMAPTPATVK